jgi:hypothetical protein
VAEQRSGGRVGFAAADAYDLDPRGVILADTPQQAADVRRQEAAMPTIEPFLLPVCSNCGGPMSLSHLEPNPENSAQDLRSYKCASCGDIRTFEVARKRATRSVTTRSGR